MAQLNPGSSLLAKSKPGSLSRNKEENKLAGAIPESEGAIGSASRELAQEPWQKQVAPGSRKIINVKPPIGGPAVGGVPIGPASTASGAAQNVPLDASMIESAQKSVVNQPSNSPYDSEISKRKNRGETLSTSKNLALVTRKRKEFLSGKRVVNEPSGDTGLVGKAYGPKIPGQERQIFSIPESQGSISINDMGEMSQGFKQNVSAPKGQTMLASSGNKTNVLGSQSNVSAEAPKVGGLPSAPSAVQTGGRAVVGPFYPETRSSGNAGNVPRGSGAYGADERAKAYSSGFSEQDFNAASGSLRSRVNDEGISGILRSAMADPVGAVKGLATRAYKTALNKKYKDSSAFKNAVIGK